MSTSSQASINSDISNYSNQDLEKNAPTRMYSKEITNSEGSTKFDTRTVSRVLTSPGLNGEEVLILGNTKIFKSELLEALGIQHLSESQRLRLQPQKSANSFSSSAPAPPGAPTPATFGNPAPLGLCAFAATTFLLSIYNCGALGISTPNVVAGMAFFYGGIVQILAGMWELAKGSTFGGLAFSSYGGFWLSYAAILTESFGIAEAYGKDTSQLNSALGFYLLTWAIFTLFLMLCTFKTTLEFFMLFFSLFVTFMLLSAHAFTGVTNCAVAGGAFGIFTAIVAWYNAFAMVTNKQNNYFGIPSAALPGSPSWKKST